MLSNIGAVTAILFADALLEQAWAAATSESWFAAPVVVALTCAVALSKQREAPVAIEQLRLVQLARAERTGDAVLRSGLDELRRLAAAREVVFALDSGTAPPLLMVNGAGRREHARVRQLTADEHSTYFFSSCPEGAVSVAAVDDPSRFAPAPFRKAHRCRRLIAIAFRCGKTWDGRLFLLDPEPQPGREAFLASLEGLLRGLLPALARLSDLHALRHRAAARERARIARDLHDGIVQGLANIDIELELIRARTDPRDGPTIDRIRHVQRRLRDETRELRMLLQRERSHDTDAARLPGAIEDIVDRFRRDSGLDVQYVPRLGEIRLSPQVCGEIARMLQEALVNVRRHSGGHHVVVRFACQRAEWTLSIEDDGRGFPRTVPGADGPSQQPLRPPSIIHERAQAVGATVRVRVPSRGGARIEITTRRPNQWLTVL
jgi:signal transduction histidine kinase